MPQVADSGGSAKPWTRGYEAAQRLRAELGRQATDEFEPSEFISIALVDTAPHQFEGIEQRDEDGRPAAILAGGREGVSQRFLVGRALWGAVSAQAREPFLLTATRASEGQQSSRAFAAELLAPAEGIRALVDESGTIDIRRLANHFNVDERVVEHQIDNQLATR